LKKYYFIVLLLFIITGCSNNQNNVQVVNNQNRVVKKETQTIFQQSNNPVASLKKEENVNYEQVLIEQNNSAEFKVDKDSYRIALVFPSKVVGKYAKDSINTTLAYLLHNNIKFQFEVFDSLTQNESDITTTFLKVQEKKFDNILVLYTKEALPTLFEKANIDGLKLYLPLVNKKETDLLRDNVIYGGLDYKAQIDKLLKLSNKKNSIFYSDSKLGEKLKDYIRQSKQIVKVSTKIEKKSNVFKKIVTNRALNNSSLFLNTSIIKSSIILSQLRAHGTRPYKILSTQLNYTPLVVSLTQYPDRKNFVIANSISKTDLKLQETLFLLDADIAYNWVNYSTLIGTDFLYSKDESKFFPSKIKNNQVAYDVMLYKNTRHGFKKIR